MYKPSTFFVQLYNILHYIISSHSITIHIIVLSVYKILFIISISLVHKQLFILFHGKNENLNAQYFVLLYTVHDCTEHNTMEFYTFEKIGIKCLSTKFSYSRNFKYFSDGQRQLRSVSQSQKFVSQFKTQT